MLLDAILPAQVFFEPEDGFKAWIEQQDDMIVDCGAGMGLLGSLYPNKIIGIDLFERTECLAPVLVPVDATTFLFREGVIALIARPSHGDWIHATAMSALNSGASCVYVGLEDNLEDDLGDMNCELIMANAGKEGEKAWQIQSVR